MNPIFGVTGWKNAGKTTLTERLVAEFVRRGWRVATVKHAHHAADIDKPGTDSFRHRAAGAAEVALVTGARYAIVHEVGREQEGAGLAEVLARLAPADLVLVEGFKREHHPKLEIYRAGVGKPLLYPDDPHIVAVASDAELPGAGVPVVSLDDIDAVIDIVLRHAVPVERISPPRDRVAT